MSFKVAEEDLNEFYPKLVEIHARKSTYELEYILSFPSSVIIDILENNREWSKKCKLEQSINFVFANNKIMRVIFDKSKKTQDFYQKNVLLTAGLKLAPEVRLKLSDEVPIPPIDIRVTTTSKIRIKNRLSISFKHFRIDVTQVVALEGNVELKTVANERIALFGEISGLEGEELYEKFLKTCKNKELEFEIEFSKNPQSIDILQITGGMAILNDQFSYMMYLNKAADVCELQKGSLKNMLSKATTLSKGVYRKIFPPVGYYITRKADGERCMYITADRDYIITHNRIISSEKSNPDGESNIIFDCEYVGGTIYVFDLLHYGEATTGETFEERYYRLVNIFSQGRQFGFNVKLKQYIKIGENMQDAFKRISEEKADFADDGFILTSYGEDYYKTRSYKIKQQNTIDFLAVCSDNPRDRVPKGKHLYYLFSGINPLVRDKLMIRPIPGFSQIFPNRFDGYMPIQFCPADAQDVHKWIVDDKLHQQLSPSFVSYCSKKVVIVELLPIFDKGVFKKWKFIKTRPDRLTEKNYFGNDFTKVAEQNWFIEQNPIKIEEMYLAPSTYFAEEKSELYRNQVSALSFAKTMLIRDAFGIVPNHFVLDLAAGKGQDLFRYMDAGFESGMFIDYDKLAIAELISRRYQSISRSDNYYSSKKFKVNVGVEDLTQPNVEIVGRLEPFFVNEKPGLIICNLAIHYLIYDPPHLDNFMGLIMKCIADKGVFVYTCFNGKKINELPDEWIDREGDVVKYYIKKDYSGPFKGFGQKISVKLPFSPEMYEETLVDIDLVNLKLKNLGFEVKTGSILDLLPLLDKKHKDINDKLNDSDKFYLGLYSYSICRKK